MKHEAHKRIHEGTLKKKQDRGEFTEGRHNAEWLARIVSSFAERRGRHLTDRQNAALDRYDEESMFDLTGYGDGESYGDEDILSGFIKLFDDLFFFGSLQERCRILLLPPRNTGNKVLGICFNTTSCDFKPRQSYVLSDSCQIEVYLTDNHPCEQHRRIQLYLGTLIHEMIHAFLGIWSCQYDECSDAWERCGPRGHGYAFQEMSAAIEATTVELLRLRLAFGNVHSMANDIVTEGGEVPADYLLARWDINKSELLLHMRYAMESSTETL